MSVMHIIERVPKTIKSTKYSINSGPNCRSSLCQINVHFIDRPGVAGAVLQTALSLIDSFIRSVGHPFVEISSEHHNSQTVRARDVTF